LNNSTSSNSIILYHTVDIQRHGPVTVVLLGLSCERNHVS